MLNSDDIKKIKNSVEEFFQKMTVSAKIDIEADDFELEDIFQEKNNAMAKPQYDILEVNIKIDDPQILIGERGQTLNEIQKLLKAILNKKTGKIFYLNLDINEYKKKKIEYLKDLARDLADEVVLNKEPKILSPMSSYERRIIHIELSDRPDIKTESEGEEPYRRVVIKPK